MSFDLKIINGDLVLQRGFLATVIDSEKLIQDILKICLTTVGSNILNPWYGSYLSRTIIGSVLDSGVTVSMAKSQLNNALDNLKLLQSAQIATFQRVSADEQISAILELSILRSNIDFRLYEIKIKALTKGLKPITTKFNVSTI